MYVHELNLNLKIKTFKILNFKSSVTKNSLVPAMALVASGNAFQVLAAKYQNVTKSSIS